MVGWNGQKLSKRSVCLDAYTPLLLRAACSQSLLDRSFSFATQIPSTMYNRYLLSNLVHLSRYQLSFHIMALCWMHHGIPTNYLPIYLSIEGLFIIPIKGSEGI